MVVCGRRRLFCGRVSCPVVRARRWSGRRVFGSSCVRVACVGGAAARLQRSARLWPSAASGSGRVGFRRVVPCAWLQTVECVVNSFVHNKINSTRARPYTLTLSHALSLPLTRRHGFTFRQHTHAHLKIAMLQLHALSATAPRSKYNKIECPKGRPRRVFCAACGALSPFRRA